MSAMDDESSKNEWAGTLKKLEALAANGHLFSGEELRTILGSTQLSPREYEEVLKAIRSYQSRAQNSSKSV